MLQTPCYFNTLLTAKVQLKCSLFTENAYSSPKNTLKNAIYITVIQN